MVEGSQQYYEVPSCQDQTTVAELNTWQCLALKVGQHWLSPPILSWFRYSSGSIVCFVHIQANRLCSTRALSQADEHSGRRNGFANAGL